MDAIKEVIAAIMSWINVVNNK